MRRFLILSALMALMLTSPAGAEMTAQSAAASMQAARGEGLLQTAYATCLGLGDKGDEATKAFQSAGWDVATDDEAGFSEIAGPEEIFALTWSDGGYCLVQSETIGTDRAAALLAETIAASGLTAVQETGEDGCLSFTLQEGDLRVEVTSSGNDPVCEDEATSGVSFMWAEAGQTPAEEPAE